MLYYSYSTLPLHHPTHSVLRFTPHPAYPPGLSLLQGGTLGLNGVVNHASRPSRKVHSNQGVFRHAPLLGGSVEGGGRHT